MVSPYYVYKRVGNFSRFKFNTGVDKAVRTMSVFTSLGQS